uniref:PDK1-type PH domain-containing protein n=1 Tax=Salix viminalis TaxID=40686 RepID=A0A6N2MK73_SALVM
MYCSTPFALRHYLLYICPFLLFSISLILCLRNFLVFLLLPHMVLVLKMCRGLLNYHSQYLEACLTCGYPVTRQQFLIQGICCNDLDGEEITETDEQEGAAILTNKPKLIYVDPSKEYNLVDNSDDLSVQVTSPSHFKICTPKKVRSFEDVKQRAWQWKKAIESLQNQ